MSSYTPLKYSHLGMHCRQVHLRAADFNVGAVLGQANQLTLSELVRTQKGLKDKKKRVEDGHSGDPLEETPT